MSWWPSVVVGLFAGSVYGLAAMGLTLTYMTSGIFNFAYGAVAMFSAFTFWQLRDGWHLTQWVALPVVLLVVGPVLGLVCERLFRPVVALSAEIQIVIALAITAFLQAVVPLIYGSQDRGLTPLFSRSTFSLAHTLYVSWSQLFNFLLTVALGVAVTMLLRRTRLGLATQAVVDNRDLAELNGVNSDSVSGAAWVVSSIFAALVGILLSATQGLDTYTLVLLVFYAFAPAVLGRLVSLPIAFGGGLALGVGQAFLQKYGSSGTLAQLEASLPYLALFAVLLLYGGRLKEVRSSFRTITGAAPTGYGRMALNGALLVAVLVVLPFVTSTSTLRDVSSGLIFAAIALTLVVLTGWAGQISLAQFTFVGIGAFTVGHLGGAHGSGFLWAAILGALIALPLGLVIGLPSLRLSGLFLALATMAFALIFDNMVFPRNSIGGGYTGISVARPRIFGVDFSSERSFYVLAALLLGVYALGAALLRRGPVGRRLQMIRDAPLGASTFGVNLTVTKLAVFAACGAAAAFAGAFYGSLRLSVDPNTFSFGASLELLLLVVLGGRSLVAGAMIAGAVSTFQLLPLSASINRYIPMAVAVGAVYLSQYPDGPISVATERWRHLSAILRQRPWRGAEGSARPEAVTAPAARDHRTRRAAPRPASADA